jgi:cytochrome c biogenesis protein CcmG/thiol:disulfide interchange protein DsbE
MRTLMRWAAATGALVLLLLVVPLPHLEEVRDVTAQSSVCDANPQPANLNFVLKDADGKDFHLASQKGKVILLDFWATWCPPCKVEIPWFVEFQQRYGPKGLAVIGVSVDDPAASLKPFGQQYKVNYPLLVGDGRDDIKGPRAYNASWGLPKTFVIGRDGKICKAHVGLSNKEHFEQQIKSLL